jgi:DNA polymerase III, beta subunit
MKLIFEKDELIKAVTPAMGSVSNKSTIPAIEGILFTPKNDSECEIVAYDLEKAFKMIISCEIISKDDNEGAFVLNANKVNQIIKTLPDGPITIEVNERLLTKIYSGKSEFELHAIDGKDFPDLPELAVNTGFTISQPILAKMIRDTQFAIATNDPRVALNGLYFTIKGTCITIVSCDTFRLAIRKQICEVDNLSGADGELQLTFIIPGKTIAELMRLIDAKDEESKVKLIVGRKHVLFAFDDFMFLSRLIEGEYIEYERSIPKQHKTFVKINRENLIQSLERAALVTEDRVMGQAKSAVKLNFDGNLVVITTKSITGRVYDEVVTESDGEPLQISFNCRYLLDALRSTDVDYLKLSMSSPLMSMIIEPDEVDENEKFLYMVLPVKSKD